MKAENGFQIISLRKGEEMENALRLACECMTEDCSRCPLKNVKECAESNLPPAILEDKDSACADWLFLYFWDKAGK
jgi:hypothetical protein